MNEENKLRKFKLIDKQGFLEAHHCNHDILAKVGSLLFTGYIDGDGSLRSSKGKHAELITQNEFQFFEETFVDQGTNLPTEKPLVEEDLYWKQDTPLKAGLIVGRNCSGANEYTVKYIGDTYAVLSDKREETTSAISNLRSLVKSDKDVIFAEVLFAWKGKTLDNAFDDKGSIVNLGSFFDTVYQVMKGETL